MKIDLLDIIFWSLIIIYFLYTIIYEKRSIRSKIIEDGLKLANYKWITSSEKGYDLYMKMISKKQDSKYKLPLKKFKNKPLLKTYKNMDYYVFNENKNNKKKILYLHGGSFIENPLFFHWEFLDDLAIKLDYEIIVPIYPKAPKYDYQKCYSILIPFLKKTYQKYSGKLIFMGDSAGGGLVLSLAMYLKKHKLKNPNKIILLSPWLDITMKNPEIKRIEKNDPQLSKKALIKAGNLWSNMENRNNYLLSPINGDVTKINNITIFIGTHDILYPDCKVFYKKCLNKNVNIDLIVYKKMLHVFPLQPIPEAKEVKKEIIKIIERDDDNEK